MTSQKKNLLPDLQTSAELLRMAVPLMREHGIPTTPQNYSVWFHYVSGDKPELTAHIDQILNDSAAFTEQLNESLYKKHLSENNLEKVDEIRQQVLATLQETSATLNHTGAEAESYGKTLEEFDVSCHSAESLGDVYGLMKSVLAETRRMKASVDDIQKEFALKSAEMEQLREELEHARQMASIDALTGLVNRGAFFDTLEEKIESIENVEDTPLCVVMFDIDHFKRVNDNFGHLVGDKVIRFVAKTLQQSIKGLDTAARYGGEEFAVLLPETAAKGAVILCNRIRERISETNLVRTGTRIPLGQITVSAGVAEYRHGEDMMELVRRADEALYQSKKQGRNQVQAAA